MRQADERSSEEAVENSERRLFHVMNVYTGAHKEQKRTAKAVLFVISESEVISQRRYGKSWYRSRGTCPS